MAGILSRGRQIATITGGSVEHLGRRELHRVGWTICESQQRGTKTHAIVQERPDDRTYGDTAVAKSKEHTLRSTIAPGPMKQFVSHQSGAATLFTTAEGRVVSPHEVQVANQLFNRAFPANAPHGYTPQVGNCPTNRPVVRPASSLSPNETAWLELRRNATIEPMRDLLSRLNITGLDTTSYINEHQSNASALPNIGIALSGGGLRAMLNGAGIIEAFDDRTPNATSAGHLGGLLQSATYMSGLSGGSWLVGSLYSNNFTSIADIVTQDTDASDSGDLWQLGNSIFEGPKTSGIQLLGSAGYYASLQSAVSDKRDAGFDASLTDYWGRALSYQLVNASDGGPAYTWSSIAEQDWFTSGSVPMPIVIADSRAPGEVLIASNTTVFAFNPWEFGTFDPTVYGFIPMQYVGTNFSGGTTRSDQCVTGFDNVGFVMGTSATLFNQALLTVNGTNSTGLFSSALQDGIQAVLGGLGSSGNDIADYPNPFYGYNNGSNPYAVSRQLTLVDGGEDLQNVPLHPLIQPLRHVDVIFAVDSSADTNASLPTNASATGWPDGASLIATYERSLNVTMENGTAFPAIPDINTFFNLGLNNRPTFFGCDPNNQTGPSPLIVYLPNAPYVYNSNTSTFDLAYNNTERNAMILNGYNGATQGNGTLDSQWATCVGCAILSRSLDRTGTTVPDVCTQCFSSYCWDGTTNSTPPVDYIPAMKLDAVSVTTSGAGRMGLSCTAALVSALAAFMLL
ncbi:Lysophospholipase 1 [Teratosphaeriaceae sp. CCFEE 6253]|nr:Lysophospholipase 1 [Teratosphaeriaceae sp. CCFEE 6253]